MAIANVVRLAAPAKATKAKSIRTRRPSLSERLALGSATAIGAVAVGATALSLSDLADSIQEVAHVAASTRTLSPPSHSVCSRRRRCPGQPIVPPRQPRRSRWRYLR
jgi:hypothetical protein